jgi:putative hydrolase of the HAD superfamily
MQKFMIEHLGFSPASIMAVETDYYKKYGNTLRGLLANGYPVSLKTWYDAVHKPLLYSGFFKPDPILRQKLLSLPGRHIIFTNGDTEHAESVLRHMGIRDCFESRMVDMCCMNEKGGIDLICKPDPRAFAMAMSLAGVTSESANIYFYDDSRANTRKGKELGWYTVQIGVDKLVSSLDADACAETIHSAI